MKRRIHPFIKIGLRGMRSWLILALLVIAGMIDGCTSSPTLHQNSQITPNRIEELVLTLSDLPEGPWRLSQGQSLNNRKMARENAMSHGRADDWLRWFESWGRIDGYRVEFQREQPGMLADSVVEDTVISEVETFRSVDGTRKSFREMGKINQSAKSTKDAFEKRGIKTKLNRFEVRKNFGVGQECYMVCVRVAFLIPPFDYLEAIAVYWRRDAIVSSIVWMSDNSAVFESDLIQLAKVQDHRIKQRQSK